MIAIVVLYFSAHITDNENLQIASTVLLAGISAGAANIIGDGLFKGSLFDKTTSYNNTATHGIALHRLTFGHIPN